MAQVYKNHDYNFWLASNYTLINPANVFNQENSEIGLNYNSYFGIQKIFKEADLFYYKKSKSKLKFGGHIYTEIEEKFTALTQLNFLLAYQILKNKKTEISIGSFFGVKNFLVQSNAFYSGTSSWDVDWSFGGTLKTDQHTLGLSLHHFIPVQFRPLDQVIKFDKEINFYYTYDFELEPLIHLKPIAMYTWREELPNQFFLGASLDFNNKVDIHCQIEQLNSIMLGGNITISKITTDVISVGFDYYLQSNSINSKAYQIRLKYIFKEK